MTKKSRLLFTKVLSVVLLSIVAGCHGSSTSPNNAGTMTQLQIGTRVTASNQIPSNILSSIAGILSSPSDTGSVPTLPTPPSSSSERIGKTQMEILILIPKKYATRTRRSNTSSQSPTAVPMALIRIRSISNVPGGLTGY